MIIFTATRADTDRLSTLLTEQGLSTVALSGELNQGQRNQIMDGFSNGQQKILITTDLASRGLDLINVSHVINFDMPKHTEEFVHRIGRTGRAGSKGDAISFVGPKDWLSFKNVEGFLQQKLTFDTVDGFKAKFKGIKPKKVKVAVKAKDNKKSATQVKKTKTKKIVKNSFLAQDAGEMPVLKRKQTIAPQDIENSNVDEVD
jgi:superfamily II DNA/RNA helicase